MGRVRHEENKLNENHGASKWLAIISVLYIATGIMMLLWPHLTLDMLGKVLGIGLLAVGAANIIIYLTKDHMDGILQMDLTEGVIFAAFGAFMLMHADFVSMALPFGIGILLLIGGISHIQYALDMRRLHFLHWKIMLVFAVILIGLGVLLIYNPFADTVLIYYMGASLILNGTLAIVSILVISHRIKQIRAGKIPPAGVAGKNSRGDLVLETPEPHAAEDAEPVNFPQQTMPAPHENGEPRVDIFPDEDIKA